MSLLQFSLESLEKNRRERWRHVIIGDGRIGGIGKVRSHGQQRGALSKAQNAKPIKDAIDRELPQDIVGAIEHHIRMSETSPHRVSETDTCLPKINHDKMEGAIAPSRDKEYLSKAITQAPCVL